MTPQRQARNLAPAFSLSVYPFNANEPATFDLSAHRGKPVLIHFLCGCDSCLAMAPIWNDLHKRFAIRNLTTIGVSTMRKGHVAEFAAQTKLRFPIYFDPNYDVAARYDAVACPRSCLIAPNGTVALLSSPRDDSKEVRNRLQNHLAAVGKAGGKR